MSESMMLDTREAVRVQFKPWMIGRVVEVCVQEDTTERYGAPIVKQVYSDSGVLLWYSGDEDKWSWKYEDNRAASTQDKKYYPSTYTLRIKTILPQNWEHYGVDGLEDTH